MWTFFVFSIIGISASILLLIRRYADHNVELIVKVATAYAWFTAMCVVALVPLDVWTTLTSRPTAAVGGFWNFAYWSTQAATWFILPFYQVYSEAGDFSIRARCWTSIKENGLLYGSLGGLGVIGIGILFALKKTSMADLMGLGIGLSNAFGLIAGLLLLGYGLVEIPRQLWKGADPEVVLKWTAHRVGKFAESVMKGRGELDSVITVIYANQRQMRRHDPLYKYMDIVAQYAEKESPIKPSELATRTVDIEHLSAEDLEYNYDKAGLAALRRRLFYAVSEYKGARCQYEEVVLEAMELEQLIKARQLQEYSLPLSGVGDTKPGSLVRALWMYKAVVRPYSNKVFAVLLVLTSLCIVWAEFTIPVVKPDMSPFSLMIKSVTSNAEFPVQALTLLPLVYICACMYYTLFRINAFNYNKLVARATTGAALMQNGSLMCRFAAPTCWNFYHIIRMSSENVCEGCSTTVFSQKMATMDVLPIHNLNRYLPVILVVMCAITALNLWGKLLNCCSNPRYRFSSDDVDDAYTEKGRLLVRKEADALSKGFSIAEVLPTAYFELEFPDAASHKKTKPVSKGLFSGMFGRKVLQPEQEAVGRPPGPPSTSLAPRHYTSAASQAASRWLPGAKTGQTASAPSGSPFPASGLQSGFTVGPAAGGGAAGGGQARGGLFEGLGRVGPAAGGAGKGPELDRGSTGATAGGGGRLALLGGSKFEASSNSSSVAQAAVSSQAEAGGAAAAGASGLDGIFAGLLGGGGGPGSTSPGGRPAAAGAAGARGGQVEGGPNAASRETDSLLGRWGR